MKLAWLVLLLLLWSGTASAAPRVAVLTFGPGDDAFSKFGHNAIVLDDGRRQLVYNFGTFRFDSPLLIVDFLKGRLEYWLSVGTLESTLDAYRARNRGITLQELQLSAAQRTALARALARNALPEHRYYAYDYFRDNCSTRVRDALERVAPGVISGAASGPGRLTYRQHALRLVADDWPLYLGLHLGLGGFADRPPTRWDETFLPEELAAVLRTTPLVTEERTLFVADRPPLRSDPPNRVPVALAAGLLLGALAVVLGLRSRRAFGVLLALWGAVAGFLGSALLLLWLATGHVAAHRNENLLLLPPWALALVVVGVAMACRKPWADRAALGLTIAGLATAFLALALKALPWFRQDNAFFIALLLPTWLGLTLASQPRRLRALLPRR